MTEKTEPGTAPDKGEEKKNTAPPDQDQTVSDDEKRGTVPYSRFKQLVDQKAAAEASLKAVVDELVNDLPEEFRHLAPNLGPAEKAAWIRQAKEAGLFNKQAADPAPSLDSKRPSGKTPPDLTKLTTHQLLSSGYSS